MARKTIRCRGRREGLQALESRVLMSTAPVNDDFGAAAVIGSVPYQAAVDTSLATAAADDPTDFTTSGHTAWYSYRATKDVRLEVDTLGSQFDTTLAVYTGPRGALTFVAGDDDTTTNGGVVQSQLYFNAQGGKTYYIMAGAFGSVAGGPMNLAVNQVPAVQWSLSVSGAKLNADGTVSITGTATTSVPLVVTFSGTGTQIVGKKPIVYDLSGIAQATAAGSFNWTVNGTPTDVSLYGKGKIEVAGTLDVVVFDTNGSIEEYTITVTQTLKLHSA